MKSTAEMIQELLGTPEDLHPDLTRFRRMNHEVGMEVIKHPLVNTIFHTDSQNALANRQYDAKRKAIREMKADGDWTMIPYVYERPWRVEAFKLVAPHLTDAQYWALLGELWIDSENIQEYPHRWARMLKSKRPGNEHMMTNEEQRALTELDDVFSVYQGHTDRRTDGYSWTTDRSIAEWFADRFARIEEADPYVTIGVVSKRNVIAYFTRRNESEILIHPNHVRIVSTKPLVIPSGTSNPARPILKMDMP